jgi:hypothetical protein
VPVGQRDLEVASDLNLWVDGLQRSEKVWGFYGAKENLATSQAYGLIRLSMERVSHCFSIGPQQRAELYPILKQWFDIPFPSAKDLAILPDSQLSTNPEREEAARQERDRRRPHADLLSMTPEVSATLSRKKMHQLAYEMGERYLRAARERRQALDPKARAAQLRKELQPMLGDIEPALSPQAEGAWRRTLPGAEAEAVSLTVEDGIRVPLLLLRPQSGQPAPVVIAVAHSGKERFLASRTADVAKLLQAGIAVCLPDVRGAGETAPAPEGGSYKSLAQREFDLGRNFLGSRLKDLRTVLAWLRTRPELDRSRMAVWGESFSPPNPADLWVDELEYEGSPQIQYRADPSGAHLALLAALYEDDVRAVVGRGALAGYLSGLGDAVTYAPPEDRAGRVEGRRYRGYRRSARAPPAGARSTGGRPQHPDRSGGTGAHVWSREGRLLRSPRGGPADASQGPRGRGRLADRAAQVRAEKRTLEGWIHYGSMS